MPSSTAARFFPDWPTRFATAILLLIALSAILAPWLATQDPTILDPAVRLQGPSAAHWLGTDALGRDLYSRVIFGSRVSLEVGAGVFVASLILGVFFGTLASYNRALDGIVMRTMDGIMAVPKILLAIALVSVSGASILTVITAVSIPEVPRVARVVRGSILAARNEPYVEAAIILGTRRLALLWRHLLPSAFGPLIVQGTYIFASAVLIEAVLGFLGAGLPPEIPSWGNIIADGRIYFSMLPGLILYPGVLLSLTILGINILGDSLRDALDSKLAEVA